MKIRYAIFVALSGAICLALSFVVFQPQLNAFLIGMSGNLFAVAIGIVIVNQYLESDARKGAVRALLLLSEHAITEFHNNWLDTCWARFGRDTYGGIFSEYLRAGLMPDALRDDVRNTIYDLYVNNPQLQQHTRDLDNVLSELSRLAGWSLDPEILEECLHARTAIARLNAIERNGSPEAIREVTEHVLDIDIHTGHARSLLMKVGGLKDED